MPRGAKKGERRGGRQKGTPNKVSRIARENLIAVFEQIGGVQAMTSWAQAEPTEFYRLYARLLPVEHVGEGGTGPIQTVVRHIYEGVPSS